MKVKFEIKLSFSVYYLFKVFFKFLTKKIIKLIWKSKIFLKFAMNDVNFKFPAPYCRISKYKFRIN